MKNSENQLSTSYLMSSIKYIILFIFMMSLLNCNAKKTDFEITGNVELIKDLTINVQKGDNDKKLENLISDNKINKIMPSEEGYYVYYISYKNTLVNKIVDDVFFAAKEPVHVFNIEKADDTNIKVTYMGEKADLKTQKGLSVILISKDAYYKANNISTPEQIKESERLFSKTP